MQERLRSLEPKNDQSDIQPGQFLRPHSGALPSVKHATVVRRLVHHNPHPLWILHCMQWDLWTRWQPAKTVKTDQQHLDEQMTGDCHFNEYEHWLTWPYCSPKPVIKWKLHSQSLW